MAPVPVNNTLFDQGVRHAILLERLKSGESGKLVRAMNKNVFQDLQEKLVARLARITERGFDTGPATTRRLATMFKAADDIIHGGMSDTFRSFRSSLRKIGASELGWQSTKLNDALSPFRIATSSPNPDIIRAAMSNQPFQGKLMREWWSGINRNLRGNVRQQIRTGIIQGESLGQLSGRLRSTWDVSRRQADSFARTAVQHVTDRARESVYKENEDVVKGVQFVAVLDSRTTDICGSLDGEVFGVLEGPRPPLHHQCRSITVPVLRSWKELGIDLKEASPGTRASLNGQVPARQSYEQWLKKQPKSTQVEALGKGRAELFRQGRLKLSKFTGADNRPLSLETLRNKDLQAPIPPSVYKLPNIRNLVDRLEQQHWKTIPEGDPNRRVGEMLHRVLGNIQNGQQLSKRANAFVARLDDETWKWVNGRATTYKPAKAGIKPPPKKVVPPSKRVEKIEKEVKKPRERIEGNGSARGAVVRKNLLATADDLDRQIKEAQDELRRLRSEKVSTTTKARPKTKSERAKLRRLKKKFEDGELSRIEYVTQRNEIERLTSDPYSTPSGGSTFQRQLDLQRKLDSLKVRAQEGHVEQLTFTGKKVKVNYEMVGTKSAGATQEAKKAVDWLEKVLGDIVDVRVKIDVGHTSRAGYSPWTRTLNMGRYDKARVFVHEFGHAIENAISTTYSPKNHVLNASTRFWERRTAGEQFTKIYRGEHGKRDKFSNHYMGKVYPNRVENIQRISSTEIVSMGIEELFSNPVGFARSDPDYFDFIVDLLRGHLR